MRKIRIHVGYKTTDAPWGGANNFIRALRQELAATGNYVFTESFDVDCDLLFMNQLSVGPGARTTFGRVRRFRASRSSPSAARLVARAVNLNRHAFRMGLRNFVMGRLDDRQVLKLVNFADFVVFQSRYQRDFFIEQGYTGTRNAVVHNGAASAFWAEHVESRPAGAALRIACSTASARASKRHDLMAKLSALKDVEVLHFGNWPARIDPGRVRRFGMVSQQTMAAAYTECDYFFHPALKDPCPNAIFEAICSGLPVIYNSGPGSSAEIVGPNGLALDETSLGETLREARRALPELRQLVVRHRPYYAVERAAREYREIFDAQASQILDR